jgi:hypothetical protein
MLPNAARTCWASHLSPCGNGDPLASAMPPDAFALARVSLGGQALFSSDSEVASVDARLSAALCPQHRHLASELDQAVTDLSNSVREVERLRTVRQKLKTEWHQTTRFVLDGARIERCILKMVMNCASVAGESLGGWQPPTWLPQVIFGQAELAHGCGLSLLVRLGDSVTDTQRASLTFGLSERDGFPVGVIFELRKGWRFLCTWDRRAEELREIRFDDEQYLPGADDLYHAKHIAFTQHQRPLGLSIDFDWSGHWSPTKNRGVVALRSKPR